MALSGHFDKASVLRKQLMQEPALVSTNGVLGLLEKSAYSAILLVITRFDVADARDWGAVYLVAVIYLYYSLHLGCAR